MSQTKKNIIGIILFILIFGGLLTVASFYDLEISKILTNGNLLSGDYYAVDTVGLIVEYIGSFPIFFFSIPVIASLVGVHNSNTNFVSIL